MYISLSLSLSLSIYIYMDHVFFVRLPGRTLTANAVQENKWPPAACLMLEQLALQSRFYIRRFKFGSRFQIVPLPNIKMPNSSFGMRVETKRCLNVDIG